MGIFPFNRKMESIRARLVFVPFFEILIYTNTLLLYFTKKFLFTINFIISNVLLNIFNKKYKLLLLFWVWISFVIYMFQLDISL